MPDNKESFALTEAVYYILLPEESNSHRKEYKITEIGKKTVKNEINRLRELVENGNKIIKRCSSL